MATTTQAIPEIEPLTAIAGARIQWLKTVPDFLPVNGWTLKYALAKSDVAPIVLTASDNGDGRHLVDVGLSVTEQWTSGEYMWQSWVEDATPTERREIGNGLITICPLFQSEEQGLDWRSHVKQTLDAVEALLANKATKDQLSYSVAGRSVARMEPDELIQWRGHYLSLWREEQKAMRRASGKTSGGKILARMRG